MRTAYLKWAAVFLLAALTKSCVRRQVTRVEHDKVIDLSGKWNETDARLAAESLIKQVLSERWLENFMSSAQRKPVVIVGLIRNHSHEHIDPEIFTKDVEKAMIRDARIRLVQAGDKREELRTERADQQNFSSEESMKKFGKELGADYMLQGTIKSIVDAIGRERTSYWQIDLELAHLETNEIVWIGDYKGKKYIVN